MNNRDLRYAVLNQRLLLGLHTLLLLVVMIINYIRNGHAHDTWSWGRVMGFTIFVPSFICWFLSRWELASSAVYSVFPKEPRKIVKTGMYARFAHPEYLFSCLNMFGYLLIVQSKYGLIVLIFVGIPLQIWRAKQEQYLCQKRFAFQYTSYVEELERKNKSNGSIHDKAISCAIYMIMMASLFAIVELCITNREARLRNGAAALS